MTENARKIMLSWSPNSPATSGQPLVLYPRSLTSCSSWFRYAVETHHSTLAGVGIHWREKGSRQAEKRKKKKIHLEFSAASAGVCQVKNTLKIKRAEREKSVCNDSHSAVKVSRHWNKWCGNDWKKQFQCCPKRSFTYPKMPVLVRQPDQFRKF